MKHRLPQFPSSRQTGDMNTSELSCWSSAKELSLAQRCRVGEPTRFDIRHRGLSEKASVLAAELTRAFIPYLEGRTRGIESIVEHAVTSSMQPKPLLILKWAHRRQSAEVVMERRSSHACRLCEFLYTQWLVEVGPEPGDRLRRSVALVTRRSDRTQTIALRTAK